MPANEAHKPPANHEKLGQCAETTFLADAFDRWLNFLMRRCEFPAACQRLMNAPPPNARTNPPPAAGGRWFLAFIGLSTALIGVLFVWLLARSYLRAREMHAWPEVECVILHSSIEERVHDPQSPRE
jgi:hypothetical protein